MKRKALLCLLLMTLASAAPQMFLQAGQPVPELQQKPTTVILIRHAEKESDGSADPDLTEKGQQRARAFASMFAKVELDAVYSSNYKRTIATVDPLAKQQELDIQIYNPGKQQDLLDKVLEEHAGENVVVVGHSNTIPSAVNYLLKQDVLKEMSEKEYDQVFIVSISANGAASLIPLVLDL